MLIQHKPESPIWGVVKKEMLFSANSSTMTQHVCEKAVWWSWGQAPLQVDSSALFLAGLLQQDIFSVSSLVFQLQAGKGNLQSLVERESVLLEPERS